MRKLLNLGPKEYVLVVDPGHGGDESGAVYKNIIEKHLNLRVSLKMRDIINESCPEIKVILTRETDKAIGVSERGRMAKGWGANFLLSVHFNAFNKLAKGSEIIYSFGNNDSKEVAEVMLDEVCNAINTHKKRVFTKESQKHPGHNWYGVLRGFSPLPALILEGLFIDNEEDIAILNKPGFIETLADAYVRGFCKGVGLRYEEKNIYGDWNEISAYAQEPVREMKRLGIMVGDGTNFNPKSSLTREDYATSLYNAFKKFNLI